MEQLRSVFIRSPSSAAAHCSSSCTAAGKEEGEDGDRASQEAWQQKQEEEEEEQQQPTANLYWTAVFEYEASAEDELSLRKGDVVEVLSKVGWLGAPRYPMRLGGRSKHKGP